MQKVVITFLLVLSVCTSNYAQEQEEKEIVFLKGQILNSEEKKPLSGAHIINLNTILGASADIDGKFQIRTAVNDTLMISHIGYQTIKLRISNDLLKGNELSISLHEKRSDIDEVVVKSHKLIGVLEVDIKYIPKDKYSRIHIDGLPQTYELKASKPKSMTSLTAALFNPVDFMYNTFGKKPKSLNNLKKLKTQDETREILSEQFDRELMLEYLEMDENELKELLDECNYSEYFVKTASDLQVIEAVLDCHENYKALKKGSLQMEDK